MWREGLLAQAVLAGRTSGYRHHPQLVRFRAHPDPPAAVARFLGGIAAEAHQRDYRFDTAKIQAPPATFPIEETDGQLRYEWSHLLCKLRQRSPAVYQTWHELVSPDPHPLFVIVPGPVRDWERV